MLRSSEKGLERKEEQRGQGYTFIDVDHLAAEFWVGHGVSRGSC